jgi:hypothetical protein
MQSAATINDAARRLEEADAIFRFKSRITLEEFDELGGQWIDARARQFNARYVQPQRELIDQGARLRRMHAELVEAAQTMADTAERELSGFFAAQDEFESSSASTLEAVQTCKDLAARANADSSRAEKEIESIDSGISAASQDPGW